MTSPLLLIVDDEFGVRESLKMVFCKDFRLMEAESVEAAIPIVLDSKPNVVLLDVLMPKTDGIQALRRIKELQPACEVIMLTGVNSQQLSTEALNSGAFDFVAKPFDVVDLRQKVGRALQNFQQQTNKS
ncbi:MAG TPA: response regulator [Candidatus Polarisedimenticolaceae bacterium]|nr:response regulator [Candidatus Polarisedimenticolaceae bacterium]